MSSSRNQHFSNSSPPSSDDIAEIPPHLQNPLYPLSESQILSFTQIFVTHADRNLSGAVPIDALPDLLMKCGLFYIQDSLRDKYLRKFSDKYGEYIELTDFLKLLATQMKPDKREASYQTLKDSFEQVFDTCRQTGYIDMEELQFVVQYLGEPLQEEELEHLLSTANMHNGNRIDYQEFCKDMLDL